MPTACPAKTWLKLIFFVAETNVAATSDQEASAPSLELQDYDLWVRPQPQRRPPGPCTARRENLHLANPAQPVHKLAVDSARHPAPRDELPNMGVAGKLQRNSSLFRNVRMIRRVRQKNARSRAVQVNRLEHRRKVRRVCCMPVGNANDLQPIRFYFFVLQYAHAGGLHRVHVLAVVAKLFVISCHEVDPMR